MTITHMLAGKDGNDNDNETPMEVSENEDDVVPFMDLVSYKGQDQMRKKVLTTPGLFQWKYSTFQVNIFLYCHHLFNICHMLLLSHIVKKKPDKRSLIWFMLSYSLFWFCLFICFFLVSEIINL